MLADTMPRRNFFKSVLSLSFVCISLKFLEYIYIYSFNNKPKFNPNPIQNKNVFKLLKKAKAHSIRTEEKATYDIDDRHGSVIGQWSRHSKTGPCEGTNFVNFAVSRPRSASQALSRDFVYHDAFTWQNIYYPATYVRDKRSVIKQAEKIKTKDRQCPKGHYCVNHVLREDWINSDFSTPYYRTVTRRDGTTYQEDYTLKLQEWVKCDHY